MDEKNKNVSDDKLDNFLTSVEIVDETVKELLDRVLLIETKLLCYESQCHRYSLQKVKTIQTCVERDKLPERLNLDNQPIGSLQCQIMFEVFAMNPLTLLTQISMKHNHLEAFGCHSMSTFIKRSSSLKELSLDGCKSVELITFLTSPLNSFVIRFDDEGAKILSDGISNSKSIDYLNCSNCNISDIGGEFLAQSFVVNKVCKEVNFSFNELAFKSAKVFEEVMMTNTALVKLDLSHNSLYEDFAVVNLLKGLSKNESLEYLDLSWNALRGEPFGKALPKAVKLSSLKILKMTNNRMSKFELKKLAIGVKRSKTIEQLFVEGNMFASGDDVILVNIFNSDSPLTLLSFGRWFQLSQNAFKVVFFSRSHLFVFAK